MEIPVAVGFGIGTAAQAAEVGRIADGVIIGSRLVRAAGEGGSPELAADAVADFLSQTRVALAGYPPPPPRICAAMGMVVTYFWLSPR